MAMLQDNDELFSFPAGSGRPILQSDETITPEEWASSGVTKLRCSFTALMDSWDSNFPQWNCKGAQLLDYARHRGQIFHINEIVRPITPRFDINRSTVSWDNVGESKLSKNFRSDFFFDSSSPSVPCLRV